MKILKEDLKGKQNKKILFRLNKKVQRASKRLENPVKMPLMDWLWDNNRIQLIMNKIDFTKRERQNYLKARREVCFCTAMQWMWETDSKLERMLQKGLILWKIISEA